MASLDISTSSPTAMAFPKSARSPTSQDQHPYAIKSTSTAILTRSNSISGNSQRPQFYSPTVTTTNAPQLGRSQSRGHRHSRSLSNPTPPQPLPLPPQSSDNPQVQRRDSLTSQVDTTISDLPDNPKLWTPRQLSVYLSSALRFKGQGAIPAPVANDIGAFVLREKLGGRAFLRLSDENLAAMGINQLWREALMSASKTLKKKVLQGRIWGFGSTMPGTIEDESPEKLSDTLLPKPIESPNKLVLRPSKKYRGGHVRGVIETFERRSSSASGSEDGEPHSPMQPSEESIQRDLKASGLWIDEESYDGINLDGEISSSSASDNEEPYGQTLRYSPQPELPELTHSRSVNTSDEPSIEELLSQEFDGTTMVHRQAPSTGFEAPSLGALAWEKDQDLIGGTAKRILDQVPAVAPLSRSKVVDGQGSLKIGEIFNQAENNTHIDPAMLLEGFKARIEKMEERLAELERRDQEREKELVLLRSQSQSEFHQPVKNDEEVVPTGVIVPHDSQDSELLKSQSNDNQETLTDSAKAPSQPITDLVPRKDGPISSENADPGASELPSYVLLVSIGVFAVVLRVLFRNVGRGRRL